jgi:uncharacterized membrane protein YccC
MMTENAKAGWLHVSQQDLIHALRTAIAAVASLLIARLCRLPEAYWAAIATLIAMQSTIGASFAICRERFIGSALGAAAGALLSTYAGMNVAAFGAGVLVLGVVCAAIRVNRAAYNYAGITLIIVMLIAHTQSPWIVALHRFIEISIGLAVGLLLTAIWPEANPAEAKV